MTTLELSYDEEGDILYITFQRRRKVAYQSLNDHIVLRYDPRTLEPLGLTLIDFSAMLPRADNSMPQFSLDVLADLPVERKEQILAILRRPPVNRWLRVTATPTGAEELCGSLNRSDMILDLLQAA